MVDPARGSAFVVRIDDVFVVEREQEGVAGIDVTGDVGIDGLVRAAAGPCIDDALALGDRGDGENTVAVDGGTTGD